MSIVAAPWPSPASAARCSGQAPQPATGAVSSRLTHCQPVNCNAGTIDSTITAHGQRDADGQPAAEVARDGIGGRLRLSSGGAGRRRRYPVELITPISSVASRPPRLVK